MTFTQSEQILDRITTYEELPGSAPIHVAAELMQIEVMSARAAAATDPAERRRLNRPLIYLALGRARTFQNPATRERVLRMGLHAARENENQDAIERFEQMIEAIDD